MKMLDGKPVKSFDWFTVLIIVLLALMGILAMTNALASPVVGEELSWSEKLASINWYYPTLQLIWLGLGLVVLFVVASIDYHGLGDISKIAYVVILVLLGILCVMKLFGISGRAGMTGWFELGNRALQPSEFGKLVLIVILAKFGGKAMEENGRVQGIRNIMTMCIYTGIPVILVMLQPDFGTAFVYLCILVGMLFAARVSWKAILTAVVTAAVGLPLGYQYILNDEGKQRILTYLNPEAADALNEGYHTAQSQMVIGSGGMTGKGFFQEGTLTQLGYLPDDHTDYIFSSAVEAMGFIGGVIIIALYFILLLRTLYIAARAKDHFGSLICIGVLSMMLAHIFENIGMVMGIMPVTGIPLPFISYGGSNMIACMLAYGLVIGVWLRRPTKRTG